MPRSWTRPAGAETKRLGAISIFTLAKDGDFNPVAIPGSEDTFNDNSDGHVLTQRDSGRRVREPGIHPQPHRGRLPR